MNRTKIKNKFAFLITLELIISLFVSFGMPNVISGAAAPAARQMSPVNNAVITASSNGVASVGFSASATDADSWDHLKLQVLYRIVGEANWHGYGSSSGNGPNGKPVIVNGIKNQYINDYGWSCAMGWGGSGPANCDTRWSNGQASGYPAWSGYSVYFPGISLTPGTYEWIVRGYDGGNYGSFTNVARFTVASPPAPPKPPTPPTPEPESPGDDYPVVEEPVVEEAPTEEFNETEDKTAPTVPANLFGEFKPEENSVFLSWESSTDENEMSGYEVERTAKDQNAWAKLNDVDIEEYVDFEFEPQKSYQYRVRAFDQSGNFSGYSNVIEVNTGEFFPNVTVKDGGKVNQDAVIMEFPAGSTEEDLFITISKIAKPNIKLDSNKKMVGDAYEIKAKNSKGEEISKFKTQVTLKIKYEKKKLSGVSESSIKLANYKDEKANLLTTSLDRKNKEAKTLTDHLSVYTLVASKASPWVTFLKVVLWIIVILGLAAAGWYLWISYQRRQYQKEHRDDYIYRS